MKKNKATRKPVLSIFWLENKLHSYYKTYLKGEKKRSAETRFKFRITIATEEGGENYQITLSDHQILERINLDLSFNQIN